MIKILILICHDKWLGTTEVTHRLIDAFMQDCSNSSANTLELLQSCTKALKLKDNMQNILVSAWTLLSVPLCILFV